MAWARGSGAAVGASLVVCLAVACGGGSGDGESGASGSGGATEGSTTAGTSSSEAGSTAGTTEGAQDDSSGAPQACELWVETDGSDDGGCTEAAPCRTVTRAIELAASGCTIRIGAGTFSPEGGEVLPWAPAPDVQLVGVGPETVLDDAAGASATAHPIACDPGERDDLRASVVLDGGGLATLRVRGPAEIGYVTVLVLGGEAELTEIVVEGGNEGIYTANDATVAIADADVSGAGHAAIKPAGDSVVTVDRTRMHASKDGLEPICRATTTVRDSEAYCNGNGLEALDRAHTTMVDNDIHHNVNGIAARGIDIAVVARGNLVHDNAFGVVVVFGTLDAGTAADPGDNVLAPNTFASMMLANVGDDTPAIGNTWMAMLDGADARGAYADGTVISGAVCSPNGAEIEQPPPDPCDVDTPITPAPDVQNYALSDGSCGAQPACGDPLPACPPIGDLLLGAP
jgi:hypothetical protein